MLKVSKLLLAAAAALGMSSALAGYAEAVPPPGFSRVGDAWTYRAANANEWLAQTVRTNATLNVGGRTITAPYAVRLAANAPRVAAAAIWLSPPLRTAAAIAMWLGAAGVVYDLATQKWGTPGTVTYGYRIVNSSGAEIRIIQASSPQAACTAAGQTWAHNDWQPGTYGCWVNSFYIYTPTLVNGPTQGQPVPLTEQQFLDKLAPPIGDPIMPADVPKALPGIDLPVELPIFNPSPGVNPSPRPLRVPFGDPKPIPKTPTAPQTWSQPVADIIGSPTVAQPWRVDVQPKDLLLDDPADAVTEPVTAPAPDPVTGVDPTPTVPKTAVELETCGLPGTPPCKIDEQGTPKEAPESIAKSADDYKTKMDELRDSVKGSGDKSMFESWRNLFLLPPLAACETFVLPRDMGSLDPCPVVDGVRAVMAYIWALTGLWLCLGMVWRSI